MALTRSNAVIFLDRQFFDFYELHLTTPLRFTFTPDTVQHMDVTAKDKLASQLNAFIMTYKLPPVSITLLLSDHMLFCKELASPMGSITEEEDVQTFLDVIPFDHVISKVYRFDKKEIIVTTNQAFVDVFQQEFNKHNSRIDICVPVFLLGKTFSLQDGLTKSQAHLIMEKLGSIRPWTLPVFQEVLPLPSETEHTIENTNNNDSADTSNDVIPEEKPKKDNSKMMKVYLVAGIFCLLFLLVGFLFYEMSTTDTKPRKQQQQTQQQTQASASTPETAPTAASVSPQVSQAVNFVVPPSPVAGAFSATDAEQKLSITIQFNTPTSSAAGQVNDALRKFGIKTITMSPAQNISGSQNIILFKNTIDAATQQRIIDVIQQLIPSISSQVNSNLSSDVLVTLNK